MVARDPAKLDVQPAMELCHRRGAEFLEKSVALGRASAIDIALNREQRVEFLYGLECDRIFAEAVVDEDVMVASGAEHPAMIIDLPRGKRVSVFAAASPALLALALKALR